MKNFLIVTAILSIMSASAFAQVEGENDTECLEMAESTSRTNPKAGLEDISIESPRPAPATTITRQ